MTANPNPRFITTPAELRDLCGQLAGVSWLALDSEFLREKTYYPKLCLLQVAVPGMAACVDPLALDDLSPLIEMLYDRRVTKVMHAARQDMEIFYHLRGELPAPVFDTQIAALLLGFPDQAGYGTLVNELLGIRL
ncbi:MAG: ribonuclease D, partial [Gammaproteobacteria bacterium]